MVMDRIAVKPEKGERRALAFRQDGSPHLTVKKQAEDDNGARDMNRDCPEKRGRNRECELSDHHHDQCQQVPWRAQTHHQPQAHQYQRDANGQGKRSLLPYTDVMIDESLARQRTRGEGRTSEVWKPTKR